MALRPEEWTYLAEGGAHILFRYQGSQACFKGKVIRIAKEGPNIKSDQLCVNYYSHIVKNYFGEEYAINMDLLSVDKEFLYALSNKVETEESRPSHRVGRLLDTEKSSCIIMNNLIREGYQYSAEIKPKWGLNCSGLEQCKFCRLQSTKKYPIGDYCPVRFFSGTSEGLDGSLKCLFDNPRNQLRIYECGKVVQLSDVPAAIHSRLLHILLTDPILSKLKACQERLFQKYQSQIFNAEISNQEYCEQLFTELSQDGLISHLAAFLAAISIEDSSLFLSFDLDTSSNWIIKIIDIDVKLPTKLKSYIEEHDYIRN